MVEGAQRSAPGHDLGLFGRLTVLDSAAIAWDGPTTELIVHDGHAPGHGAVFMPEAGILVAGDMRSDMEIPLLDTEAQDAFGDYRAGVAALAACPACARWCPVTGMSGTPPSSAGGWRRTPATWTPWPSWSRSRIPGSPKTGCARRTTATCGTCAPGPYLSQRSRRARRRARPTTTATTTRIGTSGAKIGPEETKPWCQDGWPESGTATAARPINRAATTGARIPSRAAGKRTGGSGLGAAARFRGRSASRTSRSLPVLACRARPDRSSNSSAVSRPNWNLLAQFEMARSRSASDTRRSPAGNPVVTVSTMRSLQARVLRYTRQ